MIFSIPSFRSPTPVVSLGGRWFRAKPILPVTVIGPAGQIKDDFLLDSGADDVVLPLAWATTLGINLAGAAQRQAGGIGSIAPISLLYAPVLLELTDQLEVHRWRATVAFTQTNLRLPLFGVAGGLEHFLTALNFSLSEFIMVPQPTLPATQDARP